LAGAAHGPIARLGIFTRETLERTELAGELGQAGQKLFSLSLLTCWHFEPARYPPMGEYWDANAYTASTPYVKAIPELIGYAETAVNHTIKASEVALKIIERAGPH
jgi:hypothetical protein